MASLRTCLRASGSSLRQAQFARTITTTSPIFDDQPSSSSSSSSSSSTSDRSGSFKSLSAIFDQVNAPTPGLPLNPPSGSYFAQKVDGEASSSRGYSHKAVPPLVDPVIGLFTNLMMIDGKKMAAQSQMTEILQLIQETTHEPAVPLLHRAVYLSSPSVTQMSSKRATKTTFLPRALNERQRTRQAIAWILKASERGRQGGAPRAQRVAREILAVLEGQSDVYKWLEDRHKSVAMNRSNLRT